MKPTIALLLLTPAVVGCLGASEEGLDASLAAIGGQRLVLPDGLAMDQAQIAESDETRVTFVWSSTAPLGSALSPATAATFGPVEPEDTVLHLPEDAHYRLLLALRWETSDQLVLEVRDPSGQTRCLSNTDRIVFRPVACGFPHLTGATVSGPWSVEVSARPPATGEAGSASPIPFTLEATVEAIPPPSTDGQGSHAVLGFEDSGINPYHEAFRDESPEAHEHPSTYIDGYPEDARALNLSLDASTLEQALEQDRHVWEAVERGQLYWIPGTKIVGVVGLQATPPEQGNDGVPCYLVLDCLGHGTHTIARAVGTDLSLCPMCRVAVVSDGPVGTPWLASAPWVDIIVDEFVDEVAVDRSMYQAVASDRPLVAPVMNLPMPGAWYNVHAPGTISVGGQDSGRPVPSQGNMPHVVADSCRVETASPSSLDETDLVSGTSHSTPYVAGALGALILDARTLLGDETVGVEGGLIARGEASDLDAGPLADGELTLAELRRVLYVTADPRPGEANHDGLTCLGAPAAGLPGDTDPAPTYHWFGYGAVNERTLEHAKRVLQGEAPIPQRPVEDAVFAVDQEVRETLPTADPDAKRGDSQSIRPADPGSVIASHGD